MPSSLDRPVHFHLKRSLGHALREAGKALGLVLLVAVLLVLAISGVPLWLQRNCYSPESRAALDLQGLQHASRQYAARFSEAPGRLRDLVDTGILERVPLDPWERPYVIERDGWTSFVTTLGRDGEPGGEGPDRDLSIEIPGPPPGRALRSGEPNVPRPPSEC